VLTSVEFQLVLCVCWFVLVLFNMIFAILGEGVQGVVA